MLNALNVNEVVYDSAVSVGCPSVTALTETIPEEQKQRDSVGVFSSALFYSELLIKQNRRCALNHDDDHRGEGSGGLFSFPDVKWWMRVGAHSARRVQICTSQFLTH